MIYAYTGKDGSSKKDNTIKLDLNKDEHVKMIVAAGLIAIALYISRKITEE